MLIEFLLKHTKLLQAHGAPQRLTFLKHYQRRDTAHIILRGKFLIGIDIHFHNRCLVTDLCLELLKNRRLHFTRATPCGKEIDQCRFLTIDYLIKITHNFIFGINIFYEVTTTSP